MSIWGNGERGGRQSVTINSNNDADGSGSGGGEHSSTTLKGLKIDRLSKITEKASTIHADKRKTG